ncbi:hypothetical protein FH972_006398 [Carpinus fangiana]|uniref:Uncharacterized protein n=1 Tax=Carpinus fangiana TaxID=176857 RepID=A0A5N6QUL2_9ROSI|nr:hypothetical protein FH972_006398 [Carpinus fangiana]
MMRRSCRLRLDDFSAESLRREIMARAKQAKKFYASYGYLPPPPSSPVGGHLPLDAWVDSWDPEFATLLA